MKNAAYWQTKRARSAARDRRTAAQLRRAGWKVLVLWECQMRDAERLAARIERFMAD